MRLEKLFEIQRKLDERIVEKHRLQGEDLLDKKILALQVELGELANEWRGFKFWSDDQEPRTTSKCWNCLGEGKGYFSGRRWTGNKETCITCGGTGINENENPLLEEYVDCLHFILSIGLELKINGPYVIRPYKGPNITRQFNFVYQDVSKLDISIIVREDITLSEESLEEEIIEQYDELVRGFIGLGEMLGFTWDEIEQAYTSKNAVNHERQEAGY